MCLTQNNSSGSDSGITVWDLHQMKALKLKTIEPCYSLSWMPNHDTLLLSGSGTGWVKAFDLRAPNQPCLSWHAHPFAKARKVKGIRPNSADVNIVATFSDGGGDVVRIWDLRYVDIKNKKSPQSFNINPYLIFQGDGSGNSSASSNKVGTVNDVAWSPNRHNTIAVSTSSQQTIGLYQYDQSKIDHSDFYNMPSGLTTCEPINFVKTTEIIKSFSWLPASTHKHEGSKNSVDISPTISLGNFPQFDSIPNWEVITSSTTSTFEWQDFSQGDLHGLFEMVDNKPRPKRLLGVSLNGLFDTDLRDSVPFGVSGNVAVQTIFNIPTAKVMARSKLDNESLTEKLVDYLGDSSQIQKHRATAGYSIDAPTNLDVVSEELDMLYKSIEMNHLEHHTNDNFGEIVKAVNDVHKVWLWIDRYEVNNHLSQLSLRECGIISLLGKNHGNFDKSQFSSSVSSVHPITGATHFSSTGRKLIKELCGWVDIPINSKCASSQASSYGSEKSNENDEDEDVNFALDEEDECSEENEREGLTDFNPDNDNHEDEFYLEQKELLNFVIEECLHDSFERAAVIALWHGEMDLSVQILYNAIEEYSVRKIVVDENDFGVHTHQDYERPETLFVTNEYVQLVTMVATCFAGYYYPRTSDISHHSSKMKSTERSSWRRMCNHVITMLQGCQRNSAAYLVAGCQFLLMNYEFSQEDRSLSMYADILNNEDIAIDDQISFASIYLEDEDFKLWSIEKQSYCIKEGLLQGLLFTGLLTVGGFEVLQHYINKTDDLQTVALLSSRIFYSISELDSNTCINKDANFSGSTDALNEAISLCEISKNWLFFYRNILNRWELYTERAYFDLEIHQRIQKKKDTLQSLKPSNQNNAAGRALQAPNSNFNKRPGVAGGNVSAGVALLSKPVFEEIFQTLKIPTASGTKSTISHPLYFSYIKLKCSFCGMTLPLDDLSMKKIEQLRSQKKILNCCPHCYKSLPRCYVCQLQLVRSLTAFLSLSI